MNKNWSKTTLGSLGKISMCKRILKEETSESGDIPFYKISTFGGIADAFISKDIFEKYRETYSYPKIGDVLISAAGTLGKTVIFDGKPSYFQDSNIVWVDNDEKTVINSFLYYFYQTNPWIKTTGSTINRLYNNDIKNLEISFPDLIKQQSIAAVLSALDKKIALNKQINARLEEMAKTLYDYWFVQFDFPDANGKPYKSSGGEMVFDETLKRKIPKGWEVKSLGEIENNIITGKTPSTQYSNFFNGDIPFITIGDIRNNTFIIKTEQNLSIEGANTQKNKYLPEGSLCVSCIATVGLIGFTTRQAQTNQQINSIIFKHDYNKEFLYFYLKDYFLVGKAKTGNTFANMNKGDFEKILVLYPNLRLLQKYSNKMVLVFNQINNLSKQNHHLTQLRDFLLPMLMNGQVSVAE